MNTFFKSTQHSLLLAIMTCFTLVLAGCGGGGGSSASDGSMSLSITDAPVDGVSAVVIEFTKVQVHSSNGNTLDFVLAAPKQIDLLQLTNGASEFLLDDQTLPAGDYQWIRLFVDVSDTTHSYVTDSTGDHPLEIPSNAQTGLKINRPFTISTEGVAEFVIDFDLRKSLHLPSAAGSPYKLRPTLRMVSATVVGSITGTVDPLLVNDPACTDLTASGGTVGGAVYVYSGAGVTPADVNINLATVQPLTTATVTFDITDSSWHYTAAFLEPDADYTVAFTCHSSLDDPDTTDSTVVFHTPDTVHVISGANTHDIL